jgi:hypothetical protein
VETREIDMDDLDDITILAIIAAVGIGGYLLYQALTNPPGGTSPPGLVPQLQETESAIAANGPLYYATLGAYGPGGWLVDTNNSTSSATPSDDSDFSLPEGP